MSKSIYQIEGFEELQQKIKQLPDKVKKREVLKILGQAANPTLKAAQNLAPVGSGYINVRGKRYKRKKRQVRKTVISDVYTPGIGKKSIGKKNMTRAKNPMLYISPRSRKKADGFYLRQFVQPGTKYQKSNDFMIKAYEQTKGLVTKDSEKKIIKYIDKQIARLSS